MGDKKMKTLRVYLPCYNEAENLPPLINKWMDMQPLINENNFELELTVVNDASSDDTISVVEQKKQKFSNLNLITHEVNKGLSGGLNTAIRTFSETAAAGDLMVLMDGDNTHEPQYVIEMLEKLHEGYDCVIASRYCEQSQIHGVKKYREFLSDGARVYYKTLLKVPNVEDYTCGYRIYTKQSIDNLINKYGEDPIKVQSFACMMELLYKLYLTGAAFAETPFKLRYDYKLGESKMSVLRTTKESLLTAIRLRREK